MTTLITVNDGTSNTASPTLVLGYDTSRESQNIVHDIIGGGIAVSIVRPRPRQGRLELFFETEAQAFSALQLHSREATFTLNDSERPSVSMTYVTEGGIGLSLDSATRNRWVLSVGYQEVETS